MSLIKSHLHLRQTTRGLSLRQVVQRIPGISINPDFEVQQDLIAVISAHFRNFCTGFYFLTFRYQALAVVGVRTEKLVTVLDDDEFTISNQSTPAVNHLTGCSSNNGLSFFSADVYALSGTVIGLVVADDFAAGGPHPGGRITAGRCYGRPGRTAFSAGLWCLQSSRGG